MPLQNTGIGITNTIDMYVSLTVAGVSTFDTLAHGREEVKRAAIRDHAVRWSSLTLMCITKGFCTVKYATGRPCILLPHFTALRQGSFASCPQSALDNGWCLNLCKVKCITNYTLYSSNQFVHRFQMQTQE